MLKRYRNMIELLLPSQPNNLQTLKFINSHFENDDEDKCKEANDAFEDVERIKTSLSNLRGIAFCALPDYHNNTADNHFYSLTKMIFQNLPSFTKLESIHTHSMNLDLLSLCLNQNNVKALARITELCISVSLYVNHLEFRDLYRCFPKLEKLCLVVEIGPNAHEQKDKFHQIIRWIFAKMSYCKNLRLFQLVFSFRSAAKKECYSLHCMEKIRASCDLLKYFVKTMPDIRNHPRYDSTRPLLLRLHLRSHHPSKKSDCMMLRGDESLGETAEIIQQLMMQYLITYPLGKLQFKWTYNAEKHSYLNERLKHQMKGLNGLFRVDVRKAGSFKKNNEMDRYKVYAISASKKDLHEHNVHHDNKWKTDCRWCCNTPWV